MGKQSFSWEQQNWRWSLAQGFLLHFGHAQEINVFELIGRVYKENPALAGILGSPEKETKMVAVDKLEKVN